MKISLMQRLQVRFVLLLLVSLLVLQSIIVSVSVFHSYRAITERADMIISLILAGSESSETAGSRYFIVTYSTSGESRDLDLTHSARTGKKEALDYASAVLSAGTESGYMKSWRYRSERTKDEVRIVFLSRRVQLESFFSNSVSLLVISLSGVLLMTLSAAAVSKKVVSPLVRNREKQKAFITAASHALKTPLTVISADAQILESEIGENEWLSDILKQTEKMTQMTHRLVFLSRAEEESGESVRIEFPLSDMARETASSYRAVALETGKTYFFEIEDAISFKGDEKAIRELMSVLIDNAFKYSDEKGNICISLSKKGRNVLFRVENTAYEKALEALPHFTERFFRADTSDKTDGFGIGLSLAAAVCREHGGKLTIEKKDEHTILITALIRSE